VVTVRHFLRAGWLALPVLVLSLVLAGSTGASPGTNVPCSGGAAGLAAAITAANGAGGGSITLDGGCTYKLTSQNNGNGTTGFNGLPVVTTPISIDGNGATIAVAGTDFRVFQIGQFMAPPVGSLTLRDMTLTDGNVTEFAGGAIANFGTLILDHVTVTRSTALGGGGIASSGNVVIDQSRIDDNHVPPASANGASGGGGILNFAGRLTVTNSVISDNKSPGGGGIATGTGGTGNPSLTILDHTSVDHNTAFGGAMSGGGGIANGGILVVTHGVIEDNNAPGSNGGGLLNHGTQATLIHVRVTGNTAANDGTNDGFGGGIANLYFPPGAPPVALTLVRTYVSHNSASGGGGGIFNSDPTHSSMTPTITLALSRVHDNQKDNCETDSGTIVGCTG
jgi:hypothetical protein